MGSFKSAALDWLSWLPDAHENASSSSSRARSRTRPQTDPAAARARPRARSQPAARPSSSTPTVLTKARPPQQQQSRKSVSLTRRQPQRPAQYPPQSSRLSTQQHNKLQPRQSVHRYESQPSTLDDLSYFYRAAKKKIFYNMREIDPLIGEYTHMREMPQADEALLTLRKIASCVKPIMRKRGWRVGTLSEFYPTQRNLLGLNVNRGQSILIRLRYASDKTRFLSFESVLDTMLHELVHIVQGPHDSTFNRIWQELRDEWESLAMKGYTGEGFLSNGQKLGGGLIPRDEMRRRARVEATKREQKRQQERTKKGHKVGGSRPTPGFAPRDAAAQATLRRTAAGTAAVTDGCGTGTKMASQAAADAQLNGFKTQEAMDQANAMAIQQAAIELMAMEEERHLEQQYRTSLVAPPISDGLVWDAVNGLQPAKPTPSMSASQARPETTSRPSHTKASAPSSSSSTPRQTFTTRASSLPSRKEFEVHRSGRPLSRLITEAEARQRAAKSSNGRVSIPVTDASSSSSSLPSSSPSRTWQCATCTLINDASASRCAVCDFARHHSTASSNMLSAQRPVSVPPAAMASSSRTAAAPSASSTSLTNSSFKGLEWCCMYCGNWMERKWWICDVCGHMKDRS